MAEQMAELNKVLDISQDRVHVRFIQQSGWLMNASLVLYLGNTKPTITSGSIKGDRALSASEIAALNADMHFDLRGHDLWWQTTNATILTALNGKACLLMLN